MSLRDIIIAIGVLLFIAVFIYAIVKEGRKQKNQQNSFFRKIAERKGWKYIEIDDGTAQKLAQGFEGIGVFSSPSLGKMIPRNVVLGSTKIGRICLFEHFTRIYEGFAMKWFVCVVEAQNYLGGSFVVQSKGKSGTITDNFYSGQKISIEDDWAKRYALYFNSEASNRKILPMRAFQNLFPEMENLAWPVDMQVRKNRLAVYPSNRNFELKKIEDLERLIELSTVATSCLAANTFK